MSPSDILRKLDADRVIAAWQPQLRNISRSSRYLSARHAIMFGGRYERSLKEAPRPTSAAEWTAQARALGFLGRKVEARKSFSEALRRDADCAAAWAWRWNAGAGSYDGIDRAIAIEPERALWPALRGIGKMAAGSRLNPERPLADLDRALALDASCLPASIASGMVLANARRYRRAIAFFDRSLELDPQAFFLHALRGECRLHLGDREGYVADCERALYANEGIGYFERALSADAAGPLPTAAHKIEAATSYLRGRQDYWAYIFRGNYLRAPEINDFVSGLRDMEKAVELKPDCAYAWAYLSRARLTHAGSARAMEAADRAVALRPSCGWLLIWRGEIKRRLGDAKGAMADLNAGLTMDPDYEFGYAWRGGLKRSSGDAAGALSDLDLAKALDSTYAWTLHERSLTLRPLGRIGEAFSELEAARRLDMKYSWCAKRADFPTAAAELSAEIGRRPRGAWAWAWRGEAKLQAADYAGARKDLSRALALDPGLGWAWGWRGRAELELGEERRALKDLNRAVRLEPLDAYARAWRGRARHQLGDSRGALSDLKRAAELDQKTSWIHLWKGEAAQARGLLAQAEADFDRSLGVDRKNIAAMVARAALRLRRKNGAGAREDLDKAHAAAPQDARVLYGRAALNESEGRWGEAREDYARALRSPERLAPAEKNSAARFLKRGPSPAPAATARALSQARTWMGAHRHADAAAICDEVLRVKSDSAQALRLRAEAYRCLGRYDKLVGDLDRLLSLAPNDAEAWVNRGSGRRIASDFAGALSDAREALKRSPGSPDARILESEALRNLGRVQESEDAASRAIEARPAYGWGYVVRGKTRRQGGDPDGALADFRRAARLNPRDAKARGWEADALRKSGHLEAAAAAVKSAIALEPTCAWAVALGGEIDRELGRTEDGFAKTRRAVELDGNCSCAYDFLGADPASVREDPGYAWVYAWRGGIRRKKEDWAGAREDLERAVRLDPACFWARGWLGELKLARGDAKGALDDFSRALKTHPGYGDAWTWQGRAFAQLKKWELSLASFKKTLAMNDADPWALIGCAVSLERLGQKGTATKFMNKAESIAPGLFAEAR